MSEPTIDLPDDAAEHLQTLGLPFSKTIPVSVVKKVWRDLCRQHHPDRGGDPEKFRAVTHAYEWLTNPEYRAKNDGKSVRKRSLDINIPTPIRFEEAFFGATIPIAYSVIELGGDGMPLKKEKLEVEVITLNLVPGCFEDLTTSFVFQGKGLRFGNIRGNAVVIPSIAPHPKFKIKMVPGHPVVVSEETVPLKMCLKGGKLDVQTMHGVKRLRVPAGTQPGDELIIKGAGVNGGNHHVLVTVGYPKKADLKKDWGCLRINWDNEETQDREERLQQLKSLGWGERNANGDIFKRYGWS